MGISSIILSTVTIENSVIIGARGVVNRNVSDNFVVSGVSAKVIKTLVGMKKNRGVNLAALQQMIRTVGEG